MEPTPVRHSKSHILTIALEDYFHGPAFSKVISKKRWGHFETRFEQNCLDVLDNLAESSACATFFVNSWIARKRPALLREVIGRGHEIALAGTRGLSFRHHSRASLREQVIRDRDIVEQQTGRRVLGFRVTDVLLSPKDLWALEELASLGFRYDSSLSPFLRRFHTERWRQHIHENISDFGTIWEIPLSSERIAGFLLPYAGGNYFRQFPEWLIKRLIDSGSNHPENPLVLYFRLWDFDGDQPRLQTGSVIRDFRHYRNSDRMIRMMNDLLGTLKFTSISDYLQLSIPVTTSEMPLRVESGIVPRLKRFHPPRTPISIIVPCFNEEDGIGFLANNLSALKIDLDQDYDTELVLVDDGSSDETWAMLQKYFGQSSDTKLLRHSKNLGVSAAIMTGLQHSREIACSIDCDCSYDPSELRPMLRMLKPGVDLVTASPYHPAGTVLNVPAWRLLLSKASSMLYRVVTNQELHTFTACVRVYRRSSAVKKSLRYSGFLGVAELLGKMALDGNVIVEHPATLEVRIFGQSKMKVIRTILGHLRLLGELGWSRFNRGRASENAADQSDRELQAVHFPADAEVKIEKS
jgi:polysaccharide deacetylase family protein (PEP-CTERM system associated)